MNRLSLVGSFVALLSSVACADGSGGATLPTYARVAVVVLPPGGTQGRFTTPDLLRISVGNYVGILAIFRGPQKTHGRLFTKSSPAMQERGLSGVDARENFPESDDDRQAIFAALGIDDPTAVALKIVASYAATTYPKRNAIALLGTIGSSPDDVLTGPSRAKIRAFLCRLLVNPQVSEKSDMANIVRRQALLALTLQSEIDAATATSVARVLTRTTSKFLVSTVRRFFVLHSEAIRLYPEAASVRALISQGLEQQVKEDILRLLDGQEADFPPPTDSP